jgi:hypothetical protein
MGDLSTIRRYLLAKMQSGVQMRLLEKVDLLQDETAWVGVAIAALAIAIGAWYLLRDGRRSDEVLPSA